VAQEEVYANLWKSKALPTTQFCEWRVYTL